MEAKTGAEMKSEAKCGGKKRNRIRATAWKTEAKSEVKCRSGGGSGTTWFVCRSRSETIPRSRSDMRKRKLKRM